jgi:hypothetical protein
MVRATAYHYEMNILLERAFAAAAQLSERAQESIARLILDEIEAERGWDERFANSQDQIGAVVQRAREEAARGDVLSYDPSDRPAE